MAGFKIKNPGLKDQVFQDKIKEEQEYE